MCDQLLSSNSSTALMHVGSSTEHTFIASSCLLQVFYGIPFKPGDVILTSVAEYGSNYLAFLQVMLQVLALS
jgi:selenocysteine lyase/cysteine desulfurase